MKKETVEVHVKEGLAELLNKTHSFGFFCDENGYGFGFGKKRWLQRGSWKVKCGDSEFESENLEYSGSDIGKGFDTLGYYKYASFRWNGEVRVTLTFKVYENPYVISHIKVENLVPEKHVDIDFPMFVNPESFDEELYLSAIASAYPMEWPIIKIFKPKNALEQFSASFTDGTEFLPLWVYDEENSAVFLPLDNFIDYRMVTVKKNSAQGFSLRLSGLNKHRSIEAKALIYYLSGGPSETLIKAGEILKNIYNRTPVNVDMHSYKYLGYSTANGSFYFNRFDENIILDLIRYLKENGIPAKWMQLDAMWYKSSISARTIRTLLKFSRGQFPLSSEERLNLINATWAMRGLEPDEEVFPNELKNIEIDMGVWIWTTRFDEKTSYAQKYPWIVEANLPRSKEFWIDVSKKFKDHNIMWVETDNLCDVLGRGGLEGVGEKEKWLIDVIEGFGEYNIPVQMCMTPSILYPVALKTKNAYFVRTGDDFRMDSDTFYVYQNFFNTALAWAFGLYPCFDAFFSSEKSYVECDKIKTEEWGLPIPYITLAKSNLIFEVLAHALSCGVIYIGDGIGLMDKEMIMRLCLSNGELIRSDSPAIPIKGCYFEDPLKELYPLVVYTKLKNFILIGTFNLSHQEERYSIPLKETGADGECYSFEYFSREVKMVDKEISDAIQPNRCKLYILCPNWDGFSVIGDLDKFITPYIIDDAKRIESEFLVNIDAFDLVKLGIICEERPREIIVDDTVWKDWNYKDKIVEISLGPGKHTVYIKP